MIELPIKSREKIPLSITFFVTESIILIVGSFKYPLPPLATNIFPIVFDSFIVINGDIDALGFKVLSDEYSKPSLIILRLLRLTQKA